MWLTSALTGLQINGILLQPVLLLYHSSAWVTTSFKKPSHVVCVLGHHLGLFWYLLTDTTSLGKWKWLIKTERGTGTQCVYGNEMQMCLAAISNQLSRAVWSSTGVRNWKHFPHSLLFSLSFFLPFSLSPVCSLSLSFSLSLLHCHLLCSWMYKHSLFDPSLSEKI